MGLLNEAQKEIEQAQQLDPLSPIISSNAGFYSYLQRRYDEAIQQYKKTLETDPQFWVANHYLGLAYGQKGMYREAIDQLRMLLGAPGAGPLPAGVVEAHPEVAASLGFVYGKAQMRGEAASVLERLMKLTERRYVSPLYLAIVSTGLNDKDSAIAHLDKAFRSRHPGLVLIRIDPIFDSLREDRRFDELLKRFEPLPPAGV
jgi:tetratricopeptide (TPR) repeat protein